MFHKLRQIHKVIGLINALFLLVIAVTGFLLATKSRVSWIRPEEKEGAKVESMAEVIPVDRALKAAYSAGIPELQEYKQVDRVDYRPRRNVYKILSREGYHEVQVCGKTGNVLQVAKRVDQFTEDIHDLSLWGDGARDFVLPLVGVGLFVLSLSGVVMYFIPVVRRMKHKKSRGNAPASK